MLPRGSAVVQNVPMTVPSSAGKTLLAQGKPSILASTSIDEALDVTMIHSVSGLLPPETPLMQYRPCCAAHHTIGHAGLMAVGGGRAQAR